MNHSGILAGALIVSLAFPAWADDVPASVSAPSLEQKIDFLDKSFVGQQSDARWWWWGWTSTYLALTVGTGVAAQQDMMPERTNSNWVTSVKSALGFVNMLVARPCTRCSASDTFRALPGGNAEEKAAKVKRGEELLQQYAIEGNKQGNIIRHVAGIGANAIGGLVLWLYYDDPTQAIVSFALGAAATELSIWTDPWNSPDELDAYNDFASASPQVRWWISPLPAGLALNASF